MPSALRFAFGSTVCPAARDMPRARQAANTSSISYIAIPAKAFETNWQYLTNNLVAVLGLMFVAVWIVPLLRRLDLMSVFSYLETRFHPAIRMLASGLFMLTQLGSRMSVILFLPSLAMGVRRLHDTDRSGWWWLIVFIPFVGIIVLIVFWCFEGTRGPNRFGPDPLGALAAA